MIFITVGTQLPFERLIEAMDQWSGDNPSTEVFAQVGETKYPAKHMKTCIGLSPEDYQKHFDQASVIVSHVGMGTIISGLTQGKPMVLMPRQAKLSEHRNDHQIATARKFERFDLIDIANDTSQLFAQLNMRLMSNEDHSKTHLNVSEQLENRLQDFLNNVKAGTKKC